MSQDISAPRVSEQPDGIAGLVGRTPLGVAVTLLEKRQFGMTDKPLRFNLVEPRETDNVRPPLRVYRAFNNAPDEDRRMLRGSLIHSTPQESFKCSLRAQVLADRPAHPNRRPACVGNGVEAVRWKGGEPDDFEIRKCPHEKCEFRQPQGRKPAPCKPFAQLVFQLRWKEGSPYPSMPAKFTTGSWYTTANLLGFFEMLERVCMTASGGNPVTLIGFPFLLQLANQTNRVKKTKFPVVRIVPEMDAAEFARHQHGVIKLLPEGKQARIEDFSHLEQAEDARSLMPPSPLQTPGESR